MENGRKRRGREAPHQRLSQPAKKVCPPPPDDTCDGLLCFDNHGCASSTACWSVNEHVFISIEQLKQLQRPVRVLLAGTWDLITLSDFNLMQNAKGMFQNVVLILGVHGDKETEDIGIPVVISQEERAQMIKHIRWVDEVIEMCPWNITPEFLVQHRIDCVVGSDNPCTEDTVNSNSLDIFQRLPYLGETHNHGAILRRAVVAYYRNLSHYRFFEPPSSVDETSTQSKGFFGDSWNWPHFLRGFGMKLLGSFFRSDREGLFRRLLQYYPESFAQQRQLSPEVEKQITSIALVECTLSVPGWSCVPLSARDFKFSKVTGGLTNRLYQVSLTSEAVGRIRTFLNNQKLPKIQVPQKVLLRLYGEGTETFFDRNREIEIFRLFSEQGHGPVLYGQFPGGRMEEFLELLPLSQSDYSQFIPTIAQKLAVVHSLKLPFLPTDPSLFENLQHWLLAAASVTFDDGFKAALCRKLKLDEFFGELEELQHELLQLRSPITFCHNDLLGGNIMHCSKSKRLCFIDFEYGSYNFRGYDIGNHFCEWTLQYCDNYPCFSMDLNQYPSSAQQRRFVCAYLQESYRLQHFDKTPSEEEIRALLVEINCFSLAAHLIWGFWGVLQAASSSIDFGYLEFAEKRLEAYRKLKIPFLKEHAFLPQGTPSECGLSLDQELPPHGYGNQIAHSWKATWFHRPTWCQHCGGFVVQPFGLQGFTCQTCGMKIHRLCKGNVEEGCPGGNRL